ncbi:hypothetical protein RR46_14677 [Papilio xuthus]|uniref:Uncharacterized protein n=1 Tax=Papilio xuthus TaxID=66420 RepID=A0A194PDS5_PAPXU|nr:hypothetical protein RR46_14677 [Papilio xuthus]
MSADELSCYDTGCAARGRGTKTASVIADGNFRKVAATIRRVVRVVSVSRTSDNATARRRHRRRVPHGLPPPVACRLLLNTKQRFQLGQLHEFHVACGGRGVRGGGRGRQGAEAARRSTFREAVRARATLGDATQPARLITTRHATLAAS